MSILADIILPVFGLVLLGFVAGRAGWIRENAIEGLSVFVFTFAIPVMLFRNIANADLPENMPWDFILAYYGASLMLFAATLGIARLLRLEALGASIYAMSCTYSNVVLLGIPLVITSLGEAANVPLFIIVSTHAAVMFFVTTFSAETARGDKSRLRHLPWQTLRVLVRNPIVVALAAGLVLNQLPFALPQTLDNVAAYLGSAALPCAVFSMGASISRYRISAEVKRIFMALVLKNLVHPALVWLFCALVFDVSPLWTAVAVMLAAAPSGINAYLFAQRYQVVVSATATVIVISTLVSVPVLGGILLMLELR